MSPKWVSILMPFAEKIFWKTIDYLFTSRHKEKQQKREKVKAIKKS